MWTYSDYITYARGSATYLERLRLHIQEVSNAVGTELASDAKSESANNLTRRLEMLEKELRAAEQLGTNRTGGGIGRVRMGRAL
jgi:hypothetical protein